MNNSISGNNFVLNLEKQNKLMREEIELLKSQNQELKDFIFDSRLNHSIVCPPDVNVLEKIQSYDYKNLTLYNNGKGLHFIDVTTNTDLPDGFNYSTGLVLHRSDTVTVVLFAYSSSSMAINSAIIVYDTDGTVAKYIWRGWKIL